MKSLLAVESFGAIDADADDLLLQCFEDHEAFLDIMRMRRFLVVGRKGSGKTAIFKRILTTNRPGEFSFGHAFSDYPWQYHDLQAKIGIPDADKYTHSWKYLSLLTIAKLALNKDSSLPFDDESMDSLAKLERFMVETYDSRDPALTQVFTPSKRLHLRPHFQLDWKLLKDGISPDQVPMNELPSIVQDVNQSLQHHVLRSLNPANRYFICFDQLDLGFDPNAPQYNSRLIGLLLACRDLNIAAKNVGRQLFLTVFLRDDIYNTLQFEDKNKISENFMSVIEWDTPRTNHSLKHLMEKRFDVVLGGGNEHIPWGAVFDETREMPSRQSKYDHILDRTFLRPRDIIKFCNTILRLYKEHVGDPPKRNRFDNEDIHDARPDYSDYLYRELEDEIHKHVPEYKNYLELLRAIGNWQFYRKSFDEICSSRKELVGDALPTAILQALYEFSIVGFYRAGGKGSGGSEYVFRYKDPKSKFDSTALRFRVHAGLIEALGLKKSPFSEPTDASGSTQPAATSDSKAQLNSGAQAQKKVLLQEVPGDRMLDQKLAPPQPPKGSSSSSKAATILHLSDLHFTKPEQAELWYEQLAEDLKRGLECSQLDGAILSGDITNKSIQEGYDAALLFIGKLCREFKMSTQQIVLVPGNHDMCRTASKAAYQFRWLKPGETLPEEGTFIRQSEEAIAIRDEAAYKKRFERFAKFYEQFKGEPYPLDYEEQGLLHYFPDVDLLVLGLNSAWDLDHHYTMRASINPNALNRPLARLRQDEEKYRNSRKVAVWHHPLGGAGKTASRSMASCSGSPWPDSSWCSTGISTRLRTACTVMSPARGVVASKSWVPALLERRYTSGCLAIRSNTTCSASKESNSPSPHAAERNSMDPGSPMHAGATRTRSPFTRSTFLDARERTSTL